MTSPRTANLPAARKAQAQPSAAPAAEAARSTAATVSPVPAPSAGRRTRPVLLVVPDDALRLRLESGAGTAGLKALAATLQTALASAAEGRPAGLIVDIDLHSNAALEAFSALRSRAAARAVPVVVLCATADAAEVAIATRLGISELLPRSAPVALVLHRLAQAVRMHDLVRGWRAGEAQHRALAGALPDTLLRVDLNGTIREILGVGASGLGLTLDAHGEGRRLDDLLPAPPGETFAEICDRTVSTRQGAEHELVRTEGDGVSAIDFRTVPYGADQVLVILRDVTERRSMHSGARRTLFYDSLTGLPNRSLFMSRLEAALKDGPPEPSSVAVIRLQVDQFRRIDNALGPSIADELLAEIGRRLIALVEGGTDADARFDGSLAMAARLEPDGFALLAVALPNRSACEALAERIREPLAQPVTLGGREIRSTFSIGISLWPENGDDPETLLLNSAIAANHARADGSVRLFTDTLRIRSLRGLDIEQQLRRALERDALELHYQPKVDLERGLVLGFEALLRWQPDELGKVSPAEVIPVAEQSGLIGPLGEWVLRRACRDALLFQEPKLDPIGVAVNVSAGQFAGGDLAVTARDHRKVGNPAGTRRARADGIRSDA